MIWEPLVLALVLGLVISAGLYFAYLWPSVEPVERSADPAGPDARAADPAPAPVAPPASPAP